MISPARHAAPPYLSAELLSAIRTLIGGPVDVAVILGSGLGVFADSVDIIAVISADELPGYPRSTVPGHPGRLLLARSHGLRLLLFEGRVHGYEGHGHAETVLPASIAAACHARLLLVTNAAGGLDPSFSAGDLMLITDLLVLPAARWMGRALASATSSAPALPRPLFDQALLARMRDAASEARVMLREGTYGYCSGPTYETRAEISFFRLAGAQAVGMSTAPEILTAIRSALPVLALSCITNVARTVPQQVTHEEVTQIANRTSERLQLLLHSFLRRM
ncbi:MAG: purine-nucleoside phosphorylase [Bacteroidetes bacterium]|nr:purine-nucleoside phosphorylase [Bacteroidota bacterium]